MVVFLLAGGVIADRFGRTLIIQVSNVASGICQLAIAGLVISGHAEVWQLVVISAVQGTVMAVSFPAIASVMPQLVPRDQLKQANLLVSVQRNALTVIGPAVAGLLVVTAGAGWALAVDGVTYLLAAALLLKVRIPPPVPRAERPSAVAELREGWTYFRRTEWLWVIVLAFGVPQHDPGRRPAARWGRCSPRTRTSARADGGSSCPPRRWASCSAHSP